MLAQQSKITFEHLGLHPKATCAFQDRTGYLWFGSSHGVFRYDGYSFKDYTTFKENTSNLTNAEAQAICDDNEGNIWIGHVQGLDRLDPTTDEVKHFILNPLMPVTDWSNHVLSLLEDREGKLWAGTGDGLYLFDQNTQTFKRIIHDSSDVNSIINNTVAVIYEDRSGSVWFGTGGGLDKLDSSGNKFLHVWNEKINSSKQDGGIYSILSIFEDSDGIIWLGTWAGLVEFKKENNAFTIYQNDPKDPQSLAVNDIFSINEDLNGNLWLATNGVDILNKHTKKFTHHTHDKFDSNSLSDDGVSNILVEKSGTIWISTYGRGINKYIQPNQYVKKYFLEKAEILNAGSGDLVEDNEGKIWIGTDIGLISFDPDKEIFKEELFNKTITGLLVDEEGALWMYSTTNRTLYYKNDKENEIKQFFYSDGKPFYNSVSGMANCKDGSIWIGTDGGEILKLNQTKKRIEQIAKFDNSITGLYEDKEGLLWIGTYDAGVISYNPINKISTRYISDPKDSLTLTGNQVFNFCEDGQGILWCLANSSPNKFDRINQKWIRWKGKEGFPNNAMTLIDDNKGNLWMSSASGAFKYNPFTKEVTKYNDINLSWSYKARNGELYFVSATFLTEKQSITRINPDNIFNNSFVPPVVITSFKKYEKQFPFGKEIQLPYNENFISFEFSALSFIHPEKNQYAYMMEGVNEDWVCSGTRRFASYPNLDPGEYIFRVKGSNSDGVWNETGTSVIIIISPPWWKTWWAYSTYAAIFIFTLFSIRRYEMNRLKLKDRIKLDEAVLQEKEETDKMKSRFFANISHEFRTPLTLILGPAEKISSKTSDDVIKDANIIKRNSRRLLQLINQLLDLSKLESGKLKLEVSKGNIVSFVKGVALSFESLAESKDISLKIHSEKEFIEMYFDKEKMMKILTNILSNAFKFTREEGMITVSIKENKLSSVISRESSTEKSLSTNKEIPKRVRNDNIVEIKIRDTGIGIAQEEIPKLFDRFYQVDSSHTREYEGTGIGLALTKELVELHLGRINVESEKGIPDKVGTGWIEFTLLFPLGRDHLSEGLLSEKDEEIIEERMAESGVILSPDKVGAKNLPEEVLNKNQRIDSSRQNVGQASSASSRIPQNDNEVNEDKTIILVVEDNYDMRQYIRESLDGNYLIEEAVNGEQGVRKAEKIIPDLIISDMMMPKMDGNELVRILKNDEKTSHIPIILLTAKAGQENKLEGLEIGADDYLTKPFDIKELQIRIKNLINIRRKLQEKFSKIENDFPVVTGLKLQSLDEKFLIKVNEVIEKHISEEEFSIEEFGKEVGMSRSQFHRKFIAITGKPASIYLRSVRLSRAKKMIEGKTGNISEIAYSVGFSSLSYFSKCFKEEFGFPPSDLI
ncbi:MAG: Sensor histidine kinase RcsC [Ignavibacteriaceae bacterium]|nr:Sensor histidine kinase RcsC [Ignavibacteriaceae bacterium]